MKQLSLYASSETRNTAVGKSIRTLGKHELLNSILGREAGIMPLLVQRDGFLSYPWIVVDLCAGDGVPTEESGTCSPALICKHAQYPKLEAVQVLFVERGINQYDSLAQSDYARAFECYHGANTDDYVLNFIRKHATSRSAVFLHNDPNHVEDWNLSPEMINFFHWSDLRLTTLSTLGCNVGGIKRMDRDHRQQWYDRMDALCRAIPRWHDAQIVVLNRDAAQWAYLLTGPAKWIRDGKYTNDARRAFAYWSKGLTIATRSNTREWDRVVDGLFLTKEELGNG